MCQKSIKKMNILKTKITILLVAIGFLSTAQQMEVSQCEKELATSVKVLPVNNQWNEKGKSYKYGMIRNKTIEYVLKGNPYPVTQKLDKYEKLGYYGIETGLISTGEPTLFYNNLTDAVRALYVWKYCKVVLEKGKVTVK